ncbi:CLUMA_CG000380, isoform A [Clunio marinus]|uniref:CLUMA_CG000380, isoform A n=1 Tax=Clunio marinus TaxID=568069 RepID=A0A1J1HIV7_9DIPT|nr:CLUMA_CG000380, isoform A [Clunio marinus]
MGLKDTNYCNYPAQSTELLPINGGDDDRTVNNFEKYKSIMHVKTAAIPFNNNFSVDCGGNQKVTSIIQATASAGIITRDLNIGDLRFKTSVKAS